MTCLSERSDLRDGIIGSFIYSLLLIVSALTPFTLLSLSILPLPALVYTAKHTRKAGAIFVLVLAGLSIFFGLFWLLLTLVAAGTGWAMGQFHHSERRSIRGLLIAGTVSLLAGFVLLLSLLSAVEGFHLTHELEQQWASTTAIYQEIWGQMGMEVSESELNAAQEMMLSLLPAGFLITAGSTALLNHGVGRWVLRRLEVPTVHLPPFQEWHFPRSLLAWYIVSVIVLLLSEAGSYWYSTAMTANWLITLLFVVQALSFLTALVVRFTRVPKTWTLLFFVLLFPFIAVILFILYVPLSFLGMLDIGFRFRDKFKRT